MKRILQRIATIGTTVAVAAVGVVAIAQPASAISGSSVTTVYSTVGYCVKASAAIDHYVPGVWSGNLAYGNAYLFGIRFAGTSVICDAAKSGWGRVRVDVERWDGFGWRWCRGSGWAYGSFGWSSGELGGPYGPKVLLDYGGAVCGPGEYRSRVTAEYDTGSGWVGSARTVVSPWEFVP